MQFAMQFVDFLAGFLQSLLAASRDLVNSAAATANDMARRLKQAAFFQAVEQGIKGAGTDAVAVMREFFHHRHAVDWLVQCVYQDVDPDEPEIEFPLLS